MWQPCFGKAIIMHKYVGVYILLLMYNSFSTSHVENIVEFLKNYVYIYTLLIIIAFAMKWMKIIYTCINSNSIALPKIKLRETWTENCHKNQTSCTMNLWYEHRLCSYPQTRTFAFKAHFMFSYMNLTIQVNWNLLVCITILVHMTINSCKICKKF
jgi:hypothetical protein